MGWVVSRTVFVGVFVGFSTCICQASPIVNPSFETGDLTGWFDYMDYGGMKVVSGSASDGSYYLTADVTWNEAIMGTDDGEVTLWWFGTQYEQVVDNPVGGNILTVDVRRTGDFSLGYVVVAGSYWPNKTVEAFAEQPASNGFTRYFYDLTPLSSYPGIVIIASEDIFLPSKPASNPEFSVDNIQIIPEPATISLLLIGSLTLIRRRR